MGDWEPTYARTNCKWIRDIRCARLPDAACRWLNHVLWVEAVARRRCQLPKAEYNPASLAQISGIPENKIQEYIIAMLTERIICLNENKDICVLGVRECHRKLSWKDVEPFHKIYPFPVSNADPWGIKGVYPTKQLDTRPSQRDTRPSQRTYIEEIDRGDRVGGKSQQQLEGKNKEPSDDDVLDVLPCREGEWFLRRKRYQDWVKFYKRHGVNVEHEIKLAKQWLLDSPQNYKSRAGMTRFLGNWFRRELRNKEKKNQ